MENLSSLFLNLTSSILRMKPNFWNIFMHLRWQIVYLIADRGHLLKEYLHTAYTNTHKPKHQSVFERHFRGTEEEHVGGNTMNLGVQCNKHDLR